MAGYHLSTFVGNSALLPSDMIIDFAMLPVQRFWWKTVLLLDVMWPWSNQWECVLLKNFQLCNKVSWLFYTVQCCLWWDQLIINNCWSSIILAEKIFKRNLNNINVTIEYYFFSCITTYEIERNQHKYLKWMLWVMSSNNFKSFWLCGVRDNSLQQYCRK